MGDPIAALIIAAVAVKEGREAWRGDPCCTHPNPADAAAGKDDDCASGCACCS